MKTFFTRLLLLALYSICSTTILFAREANYVQGDVLVQIAENMLPDDLVRSLQTLDGVPTSLVLKRCVAKPFRIYLLQFNAINIRQSVMLNALRQHPAVTVAQNNHLIQLRETTPNDAQFNQQWQYINPGGGSAVANADLDAELAWDITTGGVTAMGDTIVVAVLDEGCQSNHPDWGDNLWTNNAEIPNNGIDDDSNGYIDDYKGWNIYDENDNIDGGLFSGGHGTCVAGIVGAQGDNGIGVTGVNWNIKVMFLLASGNESDAIEGYTYSYIMRQRYNDSNGTQGAFVVSTNASWGVDQGQPADAPLWCAMYDQLGSVGILSAGATANANFNIDAVGDLPTACPSDYLMSVTNLGDNDVKINSAGYGLTTIDLGAYGEDTYTFTGSGGYGGFGGTSGATPHVSGTIALLYSVPCLGFAQLTKIDPPAAALLVKQMIMDGTTPNTSLMGKTVTGGRLNMYNSVMQMLAYDCSTTGCNAPYNINVSNIGINNATIAWSAIGTIAAFDVHYRLIDSPNWITINATTSPIALPDLLACATYEVSVQAICDTTSSAWSNITVFTTDGCCVPPADININAATTSAEINWETITAAGAYSVVVTDANGAATTFTTAAGVNSYTLVNLSGCSTYQVQIASFCSSGISDYSNAAVFTTNGCGACIDVDYCENAGTTDYEWIEQVTLGSIDNTSGENNLGYGVFLDQSTDLAQGETYATTIIAGFSDGSYLEFVRIWIDYNQNGIFDNNSEIAYQTADNGGEASPIYADIAIPNTAQLGSTRMRIALKYTNDPNDSDPPTACGNVGFGEVEDYCVNIIPSPACTLVPTAITVLVVADNVAQLAWTGATDCDTYDVRYRPTGSATWTNISTPTAGITLSGLTANTAYEVEVACNCGASGSAFSTALVFTTQPVGIDTVYSTVTFNLQPNPFSQFVAVNLAGMTVLSSDELRLYDVNGKIVYSSLRSDNSATWSLDLSQLAKGLYIAEYWQKGQTVGRAKLIKQ